MIQRLREYAIIGIALGIVTSVAFGEDSNITNTTTTTSTVTSNNTNTNNNNNVSQSTSTNTNWNTNSNTNNTTINSTATNTNTNTSTSNVTSNITQTQNVTNTNTSTVDSTTNNTNLSTNNNTNVNTSTSSSTVNTQNVNTNNNTNTSQNVNTNTSNFCCIKLFSMNYITNERATLVTRAQLSDDTRRSSSLYTRTLHVSEQRSRSRRERFDFSHHYQSSCGDDFHHYSSILRNTLAGENGTKQAFALEPRASTPSRNRRSLAIKRFVPSSLAFPKSE